MEKNNNNIISKEQNQAKDDGASNSRQRTHELASTSSSASTTQRSRFPPGYRFMPTDHELIVDYLMKKVDNERIPVDEMCEVELYLLSPESLAEKYPQLGDKEWYFFTPRDRKYPNGSRPSRSVKEGGYWKATGADKEIFSGGGEIIGRKKALVFYEGNPRPGEGKKTNWIMHEYKLNTPSKSPNCTGMRLDDWVLCRVYKKLERSNKKQRDVDESVPDDEDYSLESPLLGDTSELEDDNKGIVIMEDDNKGIVVMGKMAEQSPMITSNKGILMMDQMGEQSGMMRSNDNGVRDVNVYHQHPLLLDNSYQLSTNSYSMNFPYVANHMAHAGPNFGEHYYNHGMFHDHNPYFESRQPPILGSSYHHNPMGFVWPHESSTYLPLQHNTLDISDMEFVDQCLRTDEGEAPNDEDNQNPDCAPPQ